MQYRRFIASATGGILSNLSLKNGHSSSLSHSAMGQFFGTSFTFNLPVSEMGANEKKPDLQECVSRLNPSSNA
jgi:hypothetical protein